MRSIILAVALGALAGAPAAAATVTVTPLLVAQTTLPVLVNACASPNVPARVAEAFVQAPTIALEQGVSGTATVRIELDAKGGLRSHALAGSSGNPWLDAAALQSARMTRFASETRDCKAVGGTYLYAVAF